MSVNFEVRNFDFLFVRMDTTWTEQKSNPNLIGYVYLETWKLGFKKNRMDTPWGCWCCLQYSIRAVPVTSTRDIRKIYLNSEVSFSGKKILIEKVCPLNLTSFSIAQIMQRTQAGHRIPVDFNLSKKRVNRFILSKKCEFTFDLRTARRSCTKIFLFLKHHVEHMLYNKHHA